jgi:hypothetical protein
MHYKVVLLANYGSPTVGILYDGKIAPTNPMDPCPNLAQCLHFDDVKAVSDAGGIPDSSAPVPPHNF